ncbi:cysteine protease StiP family protein [Clostridium sp. CCUG 7971]|uniref:cysteine protease StiP family protein n=1 Tax=Clostridium sp. CCUG 7971 TaxID=2811414 RepID=UPI001ABBA1E1|nr:cysteine protease StiP family protein [Clostridium sp. CCUG 7971]MBO3443382.1 cysteine protease StiP family protein [Clostridium sp. CCUG 7971]
MKNFGTYSKDDVVFLLKDISSLIVEEGNKERELKIQNGSHYSEMIPIEYEVSEEYMKLYKEKLESNKEELAFAIGVMSEKIIKKNGKDVVIVSLARAGTPIGILAKRYLKDRYNLDLQHYTISIIRDKGIDINAIKYIVKNHPTSKLQFVDGWTGKGTISKELDKACIELENIFNKKFDSTLAVLADPAGYSSLYGIREDFLIPSACLNSTVSGLVSRTVLRDDLIGEEDFHGAKFYEHLRDCDESINYINTIEDCFKSQYEKIDNKLKNWKGDIITKDGDNDVSRIKEKYDVKDINFIKPGVGETTRVLLRRVPNKILVKNIDDESLRHIFILAKEKNVEVEEMDLKGYSCCGIIKNMRDM